MYEIKTSTRQIWKISRLIRSAIYIYEQEENEDEEEEDGVKTPACILCVTSTRYGVWLNGRQMRFGYLQPEYWGN